MVGAAASSARRSSSAPGCKIRWPLAWFADGFRAELDRLGYTPLSREYEVRQLAALSQWLEVAVNGRLRSADPAATLAASVQPAIDDLRFVTPHSRQACQPPRFGDLVAS